jgi:hydroxymethylbilane synthase
MTGKIRIGTRESQLAVWQAQQVKERLAQNGAEAELVYIKSEGDLDLHTPLYAMGVQGVFTRSLDLALLDKRIDLAVHSMKDVPIQLPAGITQAAVLPRGPVWDLLVYKNNPELIFASLGYKTGEWIATEDLAERYSGTAFTVATSSVRRRAQWLNRYPHHHVENLRGNVNTRLAKLKEADWDAAIFAQAGLERIGLRPARSLELDWMLPAPAQGAILVVCRDSDQASLEACKGLNDKVTALCTRIERDFLKTLLGGCSTPVSALAELSGDNIHFRGNILSTDGRQKVAVEFTEPVRDDMDTGIRAAWQLLEQGGQSIAEGIRHAGK